MKNTSSTDPLALVRFFLSKIKYIKVMYDCNKNDNPSVILTDFYHKSFMFKQNAFYTDGSKECAIEAAIFSSEMENNIRHRFPSETSIFSEWVVDNLPGYRLSMILTFLEALFSLIQRVRLKHFKILQKCNYIILDV